VESLSAEVAHSYPQLELEPRGDASLMSGILAGFILHSNYVNHLGKALLLK
jgi:hypothetical protein